MSILFRNFKSRLYKWKMPFWCYYRWTRSCWT